MLKRLKGPDGTVSTENTVTVVVSSQTLHRLPTVLDLSAPAPRPSSDTCSHDVASERDVPIEFVSKATIHNAMKHVDLCALGVKLEFSSSLTEDLFKRMKECDGKDAALRDTMRVYCNNLRGYHSAGTSVDTYFRTVLGGEECVEFPDVSYVFGRNRNPVTPLLIRPNPLPQGWPAVWSADVNCATTEGAIGASLRSYFWIVVCQAWLCVNNQFIEQNVYAPHTPRFITPLSRADVRESTDSKIEEAEKNGSVPAPPSFTAHQRAFYNSLNAIEKTIFWRSRNKRGRELAELAREMTLHEFLLAVQCKFFTTFMTAAERDEKLKNLYTSMTGHRFRLCELPNFVDRANDAVRMKVELDSENKEAMKAIRKQQRGDTSRRSTQNLGLNANTAIDTKKMPPNPAIKSVVSIYPREIQNRIPDVPFFLVHARFGPHKPIVALGSEPSQHVSEALWSIYAFLKVEDRTQIQKHVKSRGGIVFMPENEPDCVKHSGPHALYYTMRPDGDIAVLYGVHPQIFYATQRLPAVAAAATSALVSRVASTAAAAVPTAPATPKTGPNAGKKRKVATAMVPAPKTPRPLDVFSALMASDMPLPCSRYASIHSPFVMTAEIIQWWYKLAPPTSKVDYAMPGVKAYLKKCATRSISMWTDERTPFLDKYMRVAEPLESKKWEVLLHMTAATQFSHEPGFDWAQRDVWVARTLDYLRSVHANDTAVYKERKVHALIAACYQAGGEDDVVLAELCHAFSLESGLDTYNAEDMKPISKRFDRHFFVPERVKPLLKLSGFTIDIDGKKVAETVVDELVAAVCASVCSDVPVVSAMLYSSINPCKATYTGARAPAVGSAIPAMIEGLWMESVKAPLLLHAQYISNPPVGPRLASGSEWVRPKCTSVRATDDMEVLLPQINKMKNLAMSQASAIVTKAQWPKLFMTMNHGLASHSRLDLAVEWLLAEANDRKLKDMERNNQVDPRELRQRINIKSQQRTNAIDHIYGMLRMYDISARELVLKANDDAKQAASAAAAPSATGLSWKTQLRRFMINPAMFNPTSVLRVYETLVMEVDEASVPRATEIFAQHMAEIVAADEKTNVSAFDLFVRSYLSAPRPPAAAAAAASSAASARYHLIFPDDIADPVLKLCYTIIHHCFKKLGIGFTTAAPYASTQFAPAHNSPFQSQALIPAAAAASDVGAAAAAATAPAFSYDFAGNFHPNSTASADCGVTSCAASAAAAAVADCSNDGAHDPLGMQMTMQHQQHCPTQTGAAAAAAAAASIGTDFTDPHLPPLFST